jgi:undecaprenyl-diphosphatase
MLFAVGLALLLAGLAGAWRLPGLAHTDLELSLWMQRQRSPFADSAMTFFTFLGSGWALYPVVLVAAGILERMGKRREALATLLSLLAMPLNVLLKLVANRPRPGNPISVITETFGTSFPSGHSMGSAAVYGTLAAVVWAIYGRRGPVAAILVIPTLVGISRVFLGAHWGYDVLAGWASGAMVVAGIVEWMRYAARDPAPNELPSAPPSEGGIKE